MAGNPVVSPPFKEIESQVNPIQEKGSKSISKALVEKGNGGHGDSYSR
jgi:hypothetical protein